MRLIQYLLLSTTLLISALYGEETQSSSQLWNTTTAYLPLSKQINTRVEAQMRTTIKSRKLVHKHIEFEVVSPILPFVSFGAGYRQSDFTSEFKDRKDHMPFLTLTTGFSKQGWGLTYKGRAEYLFLEKLRSQDVHLYRHKLSVDIPVNMGRSKVQTFLSSELFFIEGKILTENRFKIGIRELVNKKILGDFFYQLRTVKSASMTWDNYHDIGIYTTILF
ncbi:hypothetical protein COB21_01740 [Candidatus Aerophobetes bacterium]|uniref:DUF2490 domain-containing protein n=1 Tax=Aerophobetes bacterium TaxID=2030807 RepID=A0A2A4X5V5_UNCAE|nr:MAG: hypothetical protein COB21_01740 [Candidatus Aerophobetes bacterium]